MTLSSCPRCSKTLGVPLKSSGRQVCMACGWSDRPKADQRSSDSATDSQGTVLALSVLSHGSVFLGPIVVFPIIIPLILWLACKNSTIKANAKEAFNFQIYVFFIGLLLILAFLFAGYFLFPLLVPIVILWLLLSLILPLIAMIQLLQNPTDLPTYPLIERLF